LVIAVIKIVHKYLTANYHLFEYLIVISEWMGSKYPS